MDAHGDSAGLAHDTWRWVSITDLRARAQPLTCTQLLLLRSRSKKVSSVARMALCHGRRRHILSMVLLGLQPHL